MGIMYFAALLGCSATAFSLGILIGALLMIRRIDAHNAGHYAADDADAEADAER